MGTPLRALIVEDSASDAGLVVRQLQQAGFDVTHERVESVEQMRAALEKQAWDVVLSDFRLPGFAAGAALTTLQETGLDIPFIIVSGVIDDEAAIALMRSGAHDYLMKSNLARLAPAVEREIRDACGRQERRRAAEALRASEERFRAMADSLIDAIVAVDEHNRIRFFSRGAEAMFGYSAAEVAGQATTLLMPEQHHPAHDAAFRRYQVTREPGIMGKVTETVGKRKNGEVFPVELSLSATEIGGQMLYSAVIRDITGRKHAEVELRRHAEETERARAALLSVLEDQREAAAELRASEERWKFALEGAGDGVWDLDLRTETVVYSRRYHEMYGFAEGEIGKEEEEWTRRVHPEDWPRVLAAQQAYLDGRTSTYVSEHRHLCKNGNWKWILERGMVVSRDERGRPLRMIGTHSDISERKRAEAERHELEIQLRESQKMEAIGTLAGGIAHDFNNILAAILGNAALASKELSAGHPARVSLEEINKAGARAKNLVHQILAFSHRQPEELVTQPLRPIAEEALRLLRATLPAGVEIAVALADAPLHVQADATQIEQVLMNLCTNAWHALAGHAGRIGVALDEIRLDGEEARLPGGLAPGRYARLRVSDNGCGMDAAMQARIFEPFYTTKPMGRGTGLGLAVVHGIVKAHRGTITVQSAPGEGSTFKVFLPIVAAPIHSIGEAPAVPYAPQGRGERVLYLDDDEAMVFLATRMLQDLGFHVSGFESADAALAAVRADPQSFDLVVTDFNMPRLSGLDVARELARIRPELPVVITSGYITEELRAGADAAGVRHLVYKPNTVDELCETIRRVLETERACLVRSPAGLG